MPSSRVPFNRPAFLGEERVYVEQALANLHLSSDGPFTARCQALLAEIVGAGRVFLTTSCTDALELAALLLDLQPGDEVVMPSYTFVSTANAFALRGARPVFVDVRADTCNLDEAQLATAITPRTRAICVVHYAGVGCEMDAILAVAARHGIPVIEDNAHGLFGRYRDRPLGSFGAMSALSFHETKNVSCGEGGALCINDERLIARAEILRAKGTNRARFLRGEVDKYTWVEVGSSFAISDLLAAVLHAQLELWPRIQARRGELWWRYHRALEPLAGEVTLPIVLSHCAAPFHMFQILFATSARRDAFLAFAAARGVQSVFHYVPLHLSSMGERLGYRPGALPVTESVSARLARLPFYTTMTDDEQDRVIETVLAFSREV